MEESNQSLQTLFDQARVRQDALQQLDPRSAEYKSAFQTLRQEYEECRNLVSQLALFSPNEEIDDVSTQNVPFLGLDYLLADLLLRSYDDERERTLRKALELFDDFLGRLDGYGVLSEAEREMYERFREDRGSFRVVDAGAGPEERRRVKIEKFREQKGLKEKLQYLRDQTRQNAVEDETMRSLYLAELALYSNQSFQSIDLTTQELSMLLQARLAEPAHPAPADARSPHSRPRTNGYSERLDDLSSAPGLGRYGGPLLDKGGKPLRPFTLTDKRTQLRQGVFRPDHNLPTMSIDDYLEEERRRGGIIDGGGNANEHPAQPDEDNIDAADAQTMKAREWDEFVEANPKGSGNTLNRG